MPLLNTATDVRLGALAVNKIMLAMVQVWPWLPSVAYFSNGEQGIWLDPSDFTRYMGELGPELVDTANTAAAWVPNGANTVVDDAGAVKITYVDFSNGANMALTAAKGLNTDLTLGKWYVVEFKAKVASGNNLTPQILSTAGGTLNFATLTNTEYLTCRLTFQKGTLSPSITMATMSAGEMIWVKDMTVRELTAISTATLFQDSAGTTPVTAVEQPVGLALDKRLGATLGTDVIINGGFDTDTNWVKTGSATISGGVANLPISTSVQQLNAVSASEGSWYEIQWDQTGAGNVVAYCGTNSSVDTRYAYNAGTTAGRKRCILRTAGIHAHVSFGTSAAGAATVDNVTVRPLPGNHASQPTTAQKPVLSARKNLLLYSENPAIGAPNWAKSRLNITPNAALAGAVSMSRLTEDTATGTHLLQLSSAGVNATNAFTTYSFYAKADGRTKVRVTTLSGHWNSTFDLVAGTVTTTLGTASIVAMGDGVYRCSVTSAAVVAAAFTPVVYLLDGSGVNSYTGDGVSGILFGGAQLELSTEPTTYQRVNTATDYDTVGFPHYLRFDGVDDSLATASIDFTGTDKMTVIAGVKKLSDAAGGCLVELSAIVTNPGTFNIFAPASALPHYQFGLNGSAYTTQRATTFAAPHTGVLACVYDIGGAARADEVKPRVNGAIPTLTGLDAASAGTGNFGNYPLYICRRGGTSASAKIDLHQLIIRGAATADLSAGEAFVNSKTGAY